MISLFICGTGRSGTTMLAQILSQDKRVLNIGETHIFHQWDTFITLMRRRFIKGLIKEGYPEVSDLFPRAAIEEAIVRGNRTMDILYVDLIKYYKKDIILDKTPHNLAAADRIRAMYKNPFFIHCLRNPLDVYASMKLRTWGHQYPENFSSWYSTFMHSSLEQWKRIPKDHRIILELEEMVTYPEIINESIVPALGLDQLDVSSIATDKAHTNRYEYDLSDRERQIIKRDCTKFYNKWRNQ